MIKRFVTPGEMLIETKGNYIKVADLVQYLKEQYKMYDNPDPYMGDAYYERCNGKVSILEDIMYEIGEKLK